MIRARGAFRLNSGKTITAKKGIGARGIKPHLFLGGKRSDVEEPMQTKRSEKENVLSFGNESCQSAGEEDRIQVGGRLYSTGDNFAKGMITMLESFSLERRGGGKSHHLTRGRGCLGLASEKKGTEGPENRR